MLYGVSTLVPSQKRPNFTPTIRSTTPGVCEYSYNALPGPGRNIFVCTRPNSFFVPILVNSDFTILRYFPNLVDKI